MKTLLTAVAAVMALALPLAGTAGKDETQRMLLERAQQARQSAAAGAGERDDAMHGHDMGMMRGMMAHMQQGERRDMTAQEMRQWIDEHLGMMRKMMSEHGHMMHGDDGMHRGRGARR